MKIDSLWVTVYVDLVYVTFVSYAVNPACKCVVYQSSGYSRGIFTSPNFPEIYAPGINCVLYTFMGELGEIVELTFLNFDLQMRYRTNNCTDYIRLFLSLDRPEVNERTRPYTEICGQMTTQRKFYSKSRSLIFEFHSDMIQSNNTGFKGIFKFIDKKQFVVTGGSKRWGSCIYDFHSDNRTKGGKFFSPLYPRNYESNQSCFYIFHALPNERVKVIFENIQLENFIGRCSESPDRITIRSRNDSSSPHIAQFCNTMNQKQIISPTSDLYIEFVSDSQTQRQGFAAKFQFIPEAHPSVRTPTWSTGRLPTPSPKNHSKGGNSNIPSDPPNTRGPHVTDCVFSHNSLQRKNGTFSSPRYPQPYPAPARCKYSFQGQSDERVVIEFKTMDLNYPDGEKYDPFDCIDVDAVTVSVSIDHNQRSIGTYCGSRLPPNLMSPGSRMEVLFESKSMSSCQGFLAEFRFVKNFGITTGKQKESACYFEYHSKDASNGTFTSPNHPGYYPKNTECHYLFIGKDDEKVHIQFPVFDVEGIPPSCLESTQSDYVEFSNFQYPLPDRKMDRYCGTSEAYQRKEIGSDGSFFRVAFKSNDIYDATGFSAFYQFRPIHGAHSYIHLLPKNGGPTSSKNSKPSQDQNSSSCNMLPAITLYLSVYVVALLL